MSRLSERRNMALTLDALPRQRKYLFLFSLLTGFVALQMLYLALDDMTMNLWLVVALAAGFTYSYFLEQRHRIFTEYWVSIFAFCVSVYYYLKIQVTPEYLGNYLGIMAGVLIVLLAFKAFAPSDHRFILLLETVVLIFSAVASFDLKYMLLLPLFLLAAGSTLYVASQADIISRVTDSSPNTDHSNLGTIGRTFYKVLLRAVLGLVGLSIAAYVLTPHAARSDRGLIFSSAPSVDPSGTQTPLANQQQQAQQVNPDEIQVGIGNEFNLTDNRELSSKPTPVLAVKCNRNGYLRAQVYDYYVGSGWVRSRDMERLSSLNPNITVSTFGAGNDAYAHPNNYVVPLFDFPSQQAEDRMVNANDPSASDVLIPPDNIYSIDNKVDLQYERIRQEVKLLDQQPPFYFAMYQPSQLLNVSLATGSGQQLDQPKVDEAGTLRPEDIKDKSHPKNFSYTIISLEPRYRPSDLQQVALEGPTDVVHHYTQLPLTSAPVRNDPQLPSTVNSSDWRQISPRLKHLALSIVGEGSKPTDKPLTPYQKVSAIYDYLTDTNKFHYTQKHRSVDPKKEQTEAFCIDTQEGYCRQFASAMAVLCRLNGIPSRVVSGYAPGNYSLIENAYIYKASDAHAWVEVYFDGYGWVMFDPSPSSSDLFNKSDVIRWLTGTTDFLSQLFVLDPAATQKMILESLRTFWHTVVSYGPAAVMFIFVSVMLLGFGIYMARLPRKRKVAPFTPENDVVEAFVAVRRDLARIGLEQEAGQTARSYLSQVAMASEPARAPLLQLLPLYESAAFEGAPVTPEAKQQARGVETQIREYVREELARRRRPPKT